MGDEHDIIRRAAARERGVTDREIRRLCGRGHWHRIHRGAYLPAESYAQLDEYGRHHRRAVAVAGGLRSDAALSHVSAAVLHGLALWNTPLGEVHLTRNRIGGAKRTPGRNLHASPFAPDEVTDVGGARVLTVARTVADLARTLPFEQAVVAGDHALRLCGLTTADMISALARNTRHPGHAKGLRAARFLDGRSESVGESRSRVLFVRDGLPMPMTQAVIHDDRGRWLARVDFLLPEHGVIGEFDGRVKYRGDDITPEETVWREKQREDRLRDAGWTVVRWVWDELATPSVVADRIREAIARAGRGPGPTGTFRA
ncbi:type IV toxin-antitoxin system AbiEi family antitoxin domain-containing protein [Rhodococcus sp. 11-3]|uniref:type IV toxin-antitoxin system AbiEi family antitoxin domain-containing protein n=1 Tax=Rhodococcus sp. 11-3 TaxID=2854796 RepID=UPI00203F324F|nr:type IV toxin-antitoxin system AbiEi family antitoxin domain-containing protein [Rhodococcus sp. 11-3]USC14288.1 hypothetical protein KZJ41_21965 [Rhodococcus sp. 11-3]